MSHGEQLHRFSCPPPTLPTWQDCHELWSKKRRRQMREQEQQQVQRQTISRPDGNSRATDDSSEQINFGGYN